MAELEAFNQALFLQLNATANSPSWLIGGAVFLADYLIYLIPLLLVWMWLSGGLAKRSSAIETCVVVLLALGINQAISTVWPHPRPFMIGLGHTWLSHAADPSFPSDHMTIFMSVGACLLFNGVRRLAVVTLLAGLAVGWARVFLGVHFPFDMMGAVGVAIAACAVVEIIWSYAGEWVSHLVERLYRQIFARPIAAGWMRP